MFAKAFHVLLRYEQNVQAEKTYEYRVLQLSHVVIAVTQMGAL